MKINCDYCGSQFDTDIHDTCPNCGGIYSHDPEVLAEKAKLARADELFMEQKQLENDRMRLENNQINDANKNKAASAGCMVIVLMVALIGIAFFVLFVAAFTETLNEEMGGSRGATVVSTSRPSSTEEPEVSETRQINISYTISMDPISIPEIPEINIPDISEE